MEWKGNTGPMPHEGYPASCARTIRIRIRRLRSGSELQEQKGTIDLSNGPEGCTSCGILEVKKEIPDHVLPF